jgi:hypothetical protein
MREKKENENSFKQVLTDQIGEIIRNKHGRLPIVLRRARGLSGIVNQHNILIE